MTTNTTPREQPPRQPPQQSPCCAATQDALAALSAQFEQRVAQQTSALRQKIDALEAQIRRHELSEVAARESESRVRSMLDTLEQKQKLLDAVLETVDVGVVACCGQGELTLFNRAARALHGLPPEAMDSTQWAQHYDLFAADGTTYLRQDQIPLFRALEGETVVDAEMVIAPRGRAAHFMLASGRTLLSPSGEKLGAVVAMKDVTELKESEKRLAQSEDRLRTITNNLPVHIAYLDREMRYQFANARYREWFGIDPETMVGKTVTELFGAEFFKRREGHALRCLEGETVRFHLTTDFKGEPRELESIYIPDMKDGVAQGLYILTNDITTVTHQERMLQALARCDVLTGLPNRRSFDEKLAETAARSARYGHRFALLLLDVDHFKQVNDRFGHAGGDDVLKELGGRLAAAVRATDTVARLAGDEFTIILDEIDDRKDAEEVARKILLAMAPPFFVAGVSMRVSISIGITCTGRDLLDVVTLTKSADDMLYRAKAAGRNRYYTHDANTA